MKDNDNNNDNNFKSNLKQRSYLSTECNNAK